VLAAESLTSGATGWPVVVASLSLVLLALVLAWRIGLGISRELVEATVRAAVQLLAVGAVFVFVFGSSAAMWWASLWVAVMVTIATFVVARRARQKIAGLTLTAAAAVAGSALLSIAVVLGFRVFELDPVSLVVVAGITIGNAVPSAVLAVNQAVAVCRDRVGDLEALLSLGADRRQVVRFMAPQAARSALIPQVERTKVVGLIALPGAMTGLLLAGVEPVEAVVVQLLVMYLVLGTAAVCVVTLVTAVTTAAVTSDLRVGDWVPRRAEPVRRTRQRLTRGGGPVPRRSPPGEPRPSRR
jgi:putative ABC transport system permease protein